ncbi:endonuclease V [Nocardia sp. CDC186]|uniref:Endonuclease V n=1 Tax=Nocardia implantans TaxID=3108168 RepID=A0ABU6B2R9_9NOCA|nr:MULTISPECIES: endonuclease V [unclassified Nocardia]MBF6194886.1 endonuclease V [Nocardia beijingensis]MEA3530456.1 endonuclease V [Nocardia sp. CDC192]MEB3513684.1 endonuclease V [Nocardia sp. CDC186]
MSWLPPLDLTSWPTTAEKAMALQDELRPLICPVTPPGARFRTVARLDSAYADTGAVTAAVVVLAADTLRPVASAVAHGAAAFPYVPGLLAFREIPATFAALEKLCTAPDLLVCDGQGLAHPRRRFGLACHLGLLTGVPTIGVAKTVWGEYAEPGPERGAATDITIDGAVVGRALRTRAGVKPVFVSVGHRIDLDTACAQVLALTPRYRLPETTRHADHLCRAALRTATGN